VNRDFVFILLQIHKFRSLVCGLSSAINVYLPAPETPLLHHLEELSVPLQNVQFGVRFIDFFLIKLYLMTSY
jgi:hypothetical protein